VGKSDRFVVVVQRRLLPRRPLHLPKAQTLLPSRA
jgi:hypothetical protein